MPIHCVITADLVSSRNLGAEKIEERLRELGKEIEARLFRRKKTFTFFRGDSLQAIITEPEQALRIALIWRAGIMATTDELNWDLRVAVGLGDISHEGVDVTTSGGSAFERSGTLLDEIKKTGPRIAIRSGDPVWDELMLAQCRLADGLIDRWTPGSAEAVYYQLLFDETQEQLSLRLGIAQSSVHKRLQTASWGAIRVWEESFRKHALSYLKTT